MDLFADEYICFQKYLRAIFHLRPKVEVGECFIDFAGQKIPLSIDYRDDHIVLCTDSLIDGIERAHEAAVHVSLKGKDGAEKEVVFRDFVSENLESYDPFYRLVKQVRDKTDARVSDWDVMEIGSRKRDATKVVWGLRERAKSYVGMDILAGPNVDVVGDAHKLGTLLAGRKFDFIYSQYVFEHLAMPWVAAIEMNKVMKPQAEALILSNQSIGLHDVPWDFFRFSESAWLSLFNKTTGFEVLGTALGETVRITPMRYHHAFIDHQGGAGYQASAVWVRKIADVDFRWPVTSDEIFSMLEREYPEQITD